MHAWTSPLIHAKVEIIVQTQLFVSYKLVNNMSNTKTHTHLINSFVHIILS